MDHESLKPNLRSTYLTDALREKLARAQVVIRALRAKGVRVLRTDYSSPRPLIEIDPLTAQPVQDMPVSMMSRGTTASGARRVSKVIDGCDVVWSTAA